MPTKDLHAVPFDEGTIAKLEIFEDYAEAWIPTFVMSNFSKIAIFDFFAGQGYDINNVPGSAMRILQKIKGQAANIQSKGVRIELYVNEYKIKKFDLLKAACQEFLAANTDVADLIEIHYYQDDFEDLFPRLISRIGSIPSLVYLDQNGIKAISPKYFQELEKLSQTDFLYFVSSSFFWRFGESDEFKLHLDVDITEAKKNSYRFIHRYILDQVRKGLPKNTKLMLYPYSIKKGANIHGLIFGASHPRAVDKFLRIAWKRNEINGEANFDIDDDDLKSQLDLWGEKKLTKRELFAQNVRQRVLSGEVSDNSEMLLFAHSQGHLGTHADIVLREMKKRGEISYPGLSPLVTYENVFKLRKRVAYTISKK